MFKRVEKRFKRKQHEDELGIDEEMKDILGLNNTDSDESSSDDDDPLHGDLLEDEDTEPDGADENLDSDARENEQGVDERALITVSEALNDPVFIVSLDPDIKECIICPGKLLKGSVMVEKHKSSNACTLSLWSDSGAQLIWIPVQAHERRFKQFQHLATSTASNAKAQVLVMEATGERNTQGSIIPGTSKRAEKKVHLRPCLKNHDHSHLTIQLIAQQIRKIKREKFKARKKAKKEALVNDAAVVESKKESKKNTKDVGKEQEAKRLTERKKKGKAIESLKKAEAPASSELPEELADTKKAKKHHSEGPAVPPKKKQKTSSSSVIPTVKATALSSTDKPTKTKANTPLTKQNPVSEPDDSPAVIQELQSQVRDIIKSASNLAKAARARALNGDDVDSEKKPSAKKKKAVSTKIRAQES